MGRNTAEQTAEGGRYMPKTGRRRRKREELLQKRRKRWAIVGAVLVFLAGGTVIRSMQKSREGAAAGRSSVEWSDGQADTRLDTLILVNKTHALPAGYQVNLHWLENMTCAVAEEMYPALKAMLTDGSEEGLEFVVASGYRSRETQQELLWEDIEADMEQEGLSWQEAYDRETRETMPPGYSEHSTGLAVDIVSLDYQILDAEQETTPENQWLRENCSKYGFILRYPRGKGDITGIDYESWHFRYVGSEAAREITERGITLEEYLGNTD